MRFGEFIEQFVDNPERYNLTEEEYDQEVYSNNIPENRVVVTREFREVLDSLNDPTKKFHFISGVAGTGKSTLIRQILKIEDKNVIVVAPTGISAINAKGTTIHSTFKLEPTLFPEPSFNRYKAPVFELLDILIIDEISMVKSDVLDAISKSLQIHRRNTEPFGGVTVAAFGDLFQLPPVLQDEDKEIYLEQYSTHYFFGAKCLADIEPNMYQLTRTFRQIDPEFVKLLNNIRLGKNLIRTIDIINQTCHNNNQDSDLTLTSRSQKAEDINLLKLQNIEGKEFKYYASYTGEYFENRSNKALPSPKELNLKVGAKVIFTKNQGLDYQNGSTGIVKELDNNKIIIKTDENKLIDLETAKWEWYRYEIKEENGQQSIEKHVVATYTQYPIKLGWAMTIHKSQGITLKDCIIDLGADGAFVPGQLYVGLSRCKELDKISLVEKINIQDVKIDRAVNDFYRHFFRPRTLDIRQE